MLLKMEDELNNNVLNPALDPTFTMIQEVIQGFHKVYVLQQQG